MLPGRLALQIPPGGRTCISKALATAARSDLRSASKAGKPQNLFEQFADAMFAASVDLQSAAWDGKHKSAGTARKSLGETCANCHKDYRPKQ